MRRGIAKTYIERFQLCPDHLYAWGRKPSARSVERKARRTGQQVIRLEDGFLRSIGLGHEEPPLSICLDPIGIYYDANHPSLFEELVKQGINPEEQIRAQGIQDTWREERVSKYNSSKESPIPHEPFVLVVDQTAGDLSIRHGNASGESFRRMLLAALEEWPQHSIVLKTHPDVIHGKKKGHFSNKDLENPRLIVCSDGGSPVALLEGCSAVYTVTSQVGFEALLWGRPVYTFGLPFYAGWGLTQDQLSPPERRRSHQPSLEQLIHAALVQYTHYIDPETGNKSNVENTMRWLGLQRRTTQELPDHLEVFGFTPWKARQLRRFVPRATHQTLRFRRKNSTPSRRCQAAMTWGTAAINQPPNREVPVIHVEDGFIRSKGLGANLVEAQSWVFDQRCPHYDGSKPSELELLLQQGGPLSQESQQRIQRLLKAIQEQRISKYNLRGPTWSPPAKATGKQLVLTLGQVEDDASIRFGIPPEAKVRTNADLIRAVRAQYPDAWLIYKPHPDVSAGMRRQRKLAPDWDEEARDVEIQSLLRQVDQVCVMTSLGGFEALLLGKQVTTWGAPFYAGWGLTKDVLEEHPWLKRRQKTKIDLEIMAYRCLINYPNYISFKSQRRTTPETVIREIQQEQLEDYSRRTLEQTVFRWWGALKSISKVNEASRTKR